MMFVERFNIRIGDECSSPVKLRDLLVSRHLERMGYDLPDTFVNRLCGWLWWVHTGEKMDLLAPAEFQELHVIRRQLTTSGGVLFELRMPTSSQSHEPPAK